MRETFVNLVKGGFLAQLIIAFFSLLLMVLFETTRIVGVVLVGIVSTTTSNLTGSSYKESIGLFITMLTIVGIIYLANMLFAHGGKDLVQKMLKAPIKLSSTGTFERPKLKGVGQAARVASLMPGKSKWARNIRSRARFVAGAEPVISSILKNAGEGKGMGKANSGKKMTGDVNVDNLTGSEDTKKDGSALDKKSGKSKAQRKEEYEKAREKAIKKIDEDFRDPKTGLKGSKTPDGMRALATLMEKEEEPRGKGSTFDRSNKIKSAILGDSVTGESVAEGLTKPLKDDSEIGPEVSKEGRESLKREQDKQVANTVKNFPGMGKSSETKPSAESVSEKKFAPDSVLPTVSGATGDAVTDDISAGKTAAAAGILASVGMATGTLGSGRAVSDVVNQNDLDSSYDVTGQPVPASETTMPVIATGASAVAQTIGRDGTVTHGAPIAAGGLVSNPSNYIPQDGNGNHVAYTTSGEQYILRDGVFMSPDGEAASVGTVLKASNGAQFSTVPTESGEVAYRSVGDIQPVAQGYSPTSMAAVQPQQVQVQQQVTSSGPAAAPSSGMPSQGAPAVAANAVSGMTSGNMDAAFRDVADKLSAGMSGDMLSGALAGTFGAMMASGMTGRMMGNNDNGVNISRESMNELSDVFAKAQENYHRNPGFDVNDKSTWSDDLKNSVTNASSKKAEEATSNISDPATAAATRQDLSEIVEKAMRDGLSRALDDADEKYSLAKLTDENPDDLDFEEVRRMLRGGR